VSFLGFGRIFQELLAMEHAWCAFLGRELLRMSLTADDNVIKEKEFTENK
jgi:hypothetical protein